MILFGDAREPKRLLELLLEADEPERVERVDERDGQVEARVDAASGNRRHAVLAPRVVAVA